jgi:YVTN family beta-propeller protein
MGPVSKSFTRTVCVLVAVSVTVASGCGEKSSSIEQTIKVPGRPGSPVEAAGSVWVADSTSGTVTRIDPATRKVLAEIDTDVTYGLTLRVVDDAVVAAGDYHGAVIDPQTNTIRSTFGDGDGGFPGSSRHVALTAESAFGSLDENRFVEFDPLTARQTSSIDLPLDRSGHRMGLLSYPLGVDKDAILLPVYSGGTEWLARFDLATRHMSTLHPIGPYVAIAVTDSTVWLLDRDRTLRGYDKVSGELAGSLTLPNADSKFAGLDDDSRSLVIAAEGTMWAIDQPAQILYQLDPVDATILSATELKYRPNDLLVTATSVWVADTFDDRVTVIDRSTIKPTEQPTS